MLGSRPFKPDTRTKFTSNRGNTRLISAESISQCGGVIVVTRHLRNDKRHGYGLTHTLTGAALTRQNLTNDIVRLKHKARRVWKQLDDKQKRIWQTSANAKIVTMNTPKSAIEILRKLV